MINDDIKNCIVIHGCPGSKERAENPETRTHDKHWIPWLRRELSVRGIDVVVPLMPEPWNPHYEAWRRTFEECDVSEDTILIGHSCGCAFLVRWLGESRQPIRQLILVAPWKNADADTFSRRKFYEHPIDTSVSDRVEQIVIFTADDEEEVGRKSAALLHEKLGGKLIELKGHGHYTLGDMGTEELPELLEAIVDDK